MDVNHLIDILMTNSKIKNSSDTYHDEPIIKRATQLSSYIPPKIREMRNLANDRNNLFHSPDYIFCKQGKFMADYEDDFIFNGVYTRYYPTYSTMDNRQLRGYFSWRTKVRKGDIPPTSLSFVYVYAYELLNLIGVADAAEGYAKLQQLREAYRTIDRSIEPYLRLWSHDFVIFYNLDRSLLDTSMDDALPVLLNSQTNPNDVDSDSLFYAIKAASSYNIERSKLYKLYPDEMKAVVCGVYAAMTEHYAKHRKKSFFEKLFGHKMRFSYTMFSSAVFCDIKMYNSFTYKISDTDIFTCRKGEWSRESYLSAGSKNRELGSLIKTIDSLMRQEFDVKPIINQDISTKIVTGIIQKEIDKLKAYKAAHTAPVIEIDTSVLKGIRRASDITRDKLIVDEEELETEEPEIAPLPENDAEEENDLGLDKNETALLLCLLDGGNSAALAKENGFMLSVAADAVNDKLFDRFGDTVIVFDGEQPEIIDDYADELRGILKPGL